MENSTIVNGTQIVQENMPVQPENIMIIIAVVFFIALAVGLAMWIWAKMR